MSVPCSLSCFVVNHNAGSPSSAYLWYCRFWYKFYHLCSETLNLAGHSFLSVLGYRLVSQSVLVKVSTLDINSIFISFQRKYGSLGLCPNCTNHAWRGKGSVKSGRCHKFSYCDSIWLVGFSLPSMQEYFT